jgi:predicted translin family RNA/ssDNA-binding protein
MFAQAFKAADLADKGQEEYWRHQRALSPGIQEYIEALSFSYYLEHGKLVDFDEVQRSLSSPNGVPVSYDLRVIKKYSLLMMRYQYVILTVDDYLLGISDLTGECMRYAIAAAPQRGGRVRAKQVCSFVRSCGADIEALVPRVNSPRDLRRKQNVTAASLEKIEGGK